MLVFRIDVTLYLFRVYMLYNTQYRFIRYKKRIYRYGILRNFLIYFVSRFSRMNMKSLGSYESNVKPAAKRTFIHTEKSLKIPFSLFLKFLFWRSVFCSNPTVHAMKAYKGNRGRAPLIRNHGKRSTSGLRPLYPRRKKPWYPLNSRLSGSRSQSENFGEKNTSILPVPRIKQRNVQPTA